jgi:hypothetical protein
MCWRRPAPGRYRVGVDVSEACAASVREASRSVVAIGGDREEHTGTARVFVREPSVLGIDVP